MDDKYLGFSYRGIRLGMDSDARFKGFIENSGEDLIFNNSPEFNNEFATVPFGDQTFYLGNSKTNRTFDFRVNLVEINLNDYRKFLSWLDLDSKGTLFFDYNENYGFDVKVNSIGSGQYVVVTKCDNNSDLYNVGIDLSFITTGDWAARWVKEEVFWTENEGENLIDNEDGTPFLTFNSGSSITFTNKHNLPNYFILETDGEVIIEKIGDDALEPDERIIIPPDTKFFSQYGIGTTNNTFSEIVNSRIIEIPPMEDLTIILSGTTRSKITRITPISREII